MNNFLDKRRIVRRIDTGRREVIKKTLKGRIGAVVRGTEELDKLATELAELIDGLEQEAIRDALTGAFNRGFVGAVLGQFLSGAYGRIGMIFMDVDNFKSINDMEPDGHQAGDRVLVELAAILREECPAGAIVGRWGGEELVVVVTQANRTDVFDLAARIGKSVGQNLASRAKLERERVTVSVGACLSGVGEGIADLVSRADKLMYKAKTGGKDRVEFES